MAQLKTINLTAFLASPVHIGTGEMLDPFSFVIKEGKMYVFETATYMSRLSEDKFKIITKILKNPSFSTTIEARKFINDNFDLDLMKDIILEEIDVRKSSFLESYNKNLTQLSSKDFNNKAMNQLEIEKIYSSGGLPIIPGSSIKGSIRTAIVNQLIEDNSIFVKKDYKRLMQDMDLAFTKDIFKILKISDFIKPENVGKMIGYFLNYPKDSLEKNIDSKGIDVAAEVLMPFQQFKGMLTKGFIKEHKYKEQVENILDTKSNLFKCLNRHYMESFKKDFNNFKNTNPTSQFVKVIEKQKILENLGENKFAVIRVGKHSGAEGVTIKERSITIRGSKKRETIYNAKEAGTVWYFSQKNSNALKEISPIERIKQLYPMGWVILI
jgi:CRISPR-associated protein Csm5